MIEKLTNLGEYIHREYLFRIDDIDNNFSMDILELHQDRLYTIRYHHDINPYVIAPFNGVYTDNQINYIESEKFFKSVKIESNYMKSTIYDALSKLDYIEEATIYDIINPNIGKVTIDITIKIS